MQSHTDEKSFSQKIVCLLEDSLMCNPLMASLFDLSYTVNFGNFCFIWLHVHIWFSWIGNVSLLIVLNEIPLILLILFQSILYNYRLIKRKYQYHYPSNLFLKISYGRVVYVIYTWCIHHIRKKFIYVSTDMS